MDYDWLLEMLEQRIDDRAFLGLIRKWLKAGILETDGEVMHPETGTPQGGIVSPILANVYLHYALDITPGSCPNSPECLFSNYTHRHAIYNSNGFTRHRISTGIEGISGWRG